MWRRKGSGCILLPPEAIEFRRIYKFQHSAPISKSLPSAAGLSCSSVNSLTCSVIGGVDAFLGPSGKEESGGSVGVLGLGRCGGC